MWWTGVAAPTTPRPRVACAATPRPRGGRRGHRSRPQGGPRSHSEPRSVAAPATQWPGSGRVGHPYGLGWLRRPPRGWGCSLATLAPLPLWLLLWPSSSPLAALIYDLVFCSYFKFVHFFLMNDMSRFDWWATNP
jgi:hypothetical protein